ncbi:hypothetical protein Dtox_3032 [Desulfofarcimen acetoxidans DSM 771]|uniref:Uncharacterized protein n=1 Tax=Desulfofarcimen acetoxidans (strain ATCC 49208 / DSM 771 / KCTC 5769 / VKM B-1644 / 5575) TaxID=485916 RepID=C8W3J8_DESAS|nr:zinc/iron-chelating domain-containing protein [Desulfofarcimen acetoxidans]ACV63784.1 hypothetical protein Dtox_3032 [Desulfofarcimen acetoxidans DSM 771]
MSTELLTEAQLSEITLNPDKEIAINNIYQLYQIIDQANLQLKQVHDVPDCLRCGVCCNGVFEVSPVEARVIQVALEGYVPSGLFPPISEESLRSRLNMASDQLSNALCNNHFVCPFYNNRFGCLAYQVRSVICRVFETAVPDFSFIPELNEDILGDTDIKKSGFLCPNLKKAKKYPGTFAVWDYTGLISVLEQIYPGTTKYEARLLAFFKYPVDIIALKGLPYKFRLNNFLKVIHPG